ncbi:hypothetical protein CONPUDRAFT_142748 [Coniophora puteana RWD-64-598 SS2]|uniref:Uncharacterized protein n=1 Tax=Coniophora puteana (strain RWD-64-598) TaxID=741705 RepID=A0A5M3MZ86_CONPW|nr:uncharacterized protein CONPUDRAFT_142748 [Coniophora puteana RWD-64-598 SS2]EIW84458.1 hypothetical protein CONPUDRAFT_142748 [Coniophora puteana RWD-64-598 SS2]
MLDARGYSWRRWWTYDERDASDVEMSRPRDAEGQPEVRYSLVQSGMGMRLGSELDVGGMRASDVGRLAWWRDGIRRSIPSRPGSAVVGARDAGDIPKCMMSRANITHKDTCLARLDEKFGAFYSSSGLFDESRVGQELIDVSEPGPPRTVLGKKTLLLRAKGFRVESITVKTLRKIRSNLAGFSSLIMNHMLDHWHMNRSAVAPIDVMPSTAAGKRGRRVLTKKDEIVGSESCMFQTWVLNTFTDERWNVGQPEWFVRV